MSNNFKVFIGIDPGASGGIAWNLPGVGMQAKAFPKERMDIAAFIRSIISSILVHGIPNDNVHVYAERVAGFIKKPQDDPKEFRLEGQAFAMFNFGFKTGYLIALFEAHGYTVQELGPSHWQRFYESTKGMPRAAKKNALKAIAQRFYPQLKVTLGTADALLIRRAGELLWNGHSPKSEPYLESLSLSGEEMNAHASCIPKKKHPRGARGGPRIKPATFRTISFREKS